LGPFSHQGCQQVLISPTFYEQLLAKILLPKITKPNCKHIKTAKKLLYEKAARKILVNLTPGWLDSNP
jgi:hypothetical protein